MPGHDKSGNHEFTFGRTTVFVAPGRVRRCNYANRESVVAAYSIPVFARETCCVKTS